MLCNACMPVLCTCTIPGPALHYTTVLHRTKLILRLCASPIPSRPAAYDVKQRQRKTKNLTFPWSWICPSLGKIYTKNPLPPSQSATTKILAVTGTHKIFWLLLSAQSGRQQKTKKENQENKNARVPSCTMTMVTRVSYTGTHL